MSEAKHTPGPWTLEDIGYGSFSIEAKRHDNGRPCVIAVRHDWLSYAETSNANGRLIAAAPDLLEALELVMDRLVDRHEEDIAAVTSRAAIAKARGKA